MNYLEHLLQNLLTVIFRVHILWAEDSVYLAGFCKLDCIFLVGLENSAFLKDVP